jgi:DNA-binding NarL/FixJ family response regulator
VPRRRTGHVEQQNAAPGHRSIRLLIAARPGLWSEILARQLGDEEDVTVVGRVHDEEHIRLLASESNPQVILLDREAFGEDCERMITRLRAKLPAARTLVFTARSSDETELVFVRAGAAGVVEKGRGFSMLLTALRAVAAGELWARRRVIAQALELMQQAVRDSLRDLALSRREREVVGAVQRGMRNSEVAEALGITERTVKRHLSNIFAKTGVNDRSELVRLILRAEGGERPA